MTTQNPAKPETLKDYWVVWHYLADHGVNYMPAFSVEDAAERMWRDVFPDPAFKERAKLYVFDKKPVAFNVPAR